ncbi:MAG: hypothetical protein JXR96_31210, partial [Deltaproteobacteria bacterium]|nr:hypothetical protein [Deltaproteobacteria bacterium]
MRFSLACLLCSLLLAAPAAAQDGYWGKVDMSSFGSSGDAFQDVFFLDANAGWIVGDNGLVLYTNTGGSMAADWSEATVVPTSGILRKVHFIDLDKGWAVGDSGTVIRTTDGGDSWEAIGSLSTSTPVTSVFFSNENEGWISTDIETRPIYKTSDGGDNWGMVSTLNEAKKGLDILVVGSNIWLSCSESFSDKQGYLLWSINDGVDWDIEHVPLEKDMFALTYDGTVVWAAGQQGTILENTDMDNNVWLPHNLSDTNTTLYDVGFSPNPDVAWVVGDTGSGGGGIWITENRDSWTLDASDPTSIFRAIDAKASNRAWAVGDDRTLYTYRECQQDSHCGTTYCNGLLWMQPVCQDGVCVTPQSTDCDTGIECQQGTCDDAGGCGQTPLTGTDCGSTACQGLQYGHEICESGVCSGFRQIDDCSAVPECQQGTCDDAGGCGQTPLTGTDCGSTACQGLLFGHEICESGACSGFREIDDCSASPECQQGTCDDAGGCGQTPLTGTDCGSTACQGLQYGHEICESGACSGFRQIDDCS